MDFAQLKKKALETKDKLIATGTQKIVASEIVINSREELDEFIKKSQTKSFTSKETGETKEFIKKVIVLFAEKDSDFLKKALLQGMIFYTKTFSQNISFKICNISEKELGGVGVSSFPSLVVFETEKIIHTVEGEELITKVMKDLSLDIMATIENI